MNDLLLTLVAAYQRLREEQRDLFLELSYSAQDRMSLSITLARYFYAQGFPGYSPEMIQKQMSEGELQAVLYLLVCGETGEHVVQVMLPRLEKQHGKQKRTASPKVAAPVPEVPPGDGPDGGFTHTRRRTGRFAGRVGERYTRPVSGAFLPPRVGDRYPRPGAPLSSPLAIPPVAPERDHVMPSNASSSRTKLIGSSPSQAKVPAPRPKSGVQVKSTPPPKEKPPLPKTKVAASSPQPPSLRSKRVPGTGAGPSKTGSGAVLASAPKKKASSSSSRSSPKPGRPRATVSTPKPTSSSQPNPMASSPGMGTDDPTGQVQGQVSPQQGQQLSPNHAIHNIKFNIQTAIPHGNPPTPQQSQTPPGMGMGASDPTMQAGQDTGPTGIGPQQKPPVGSTLPKRPPREPKPPPDASTARAIQDATLKERQRRETQGKPRSGVRDVDAGAGFWPPLSPLL